MIIKQMFGTQMVPTDGEQAAEVKLRVITTEGKRAQGEYAMSVMERILPCYNFYFGASRGMQ